MRRALALLLLLAACQLGADAGRTLDGRVVHVKDGDSFEMKTPAGVRVEVRIAYIDSPERDQPWAGKSRAALETRIARREVRVRQTDVDVYGRVVGEVNVGDRCIGCEQLRDGNAWVFRRFSRDPALLALEDEARAAKRGLWSLPAEQRVPPWEWREQARSSHAARMKSACDPAPRSDRIRSCDEARRLLAQCGPAGLDGDGDGVPCERLCD
jgi:endonuclease YncB( thermonuclease family)